jgi:DNA-binding NtrC family response regulator
VYSPAALEVLVAYPWPGNIRELRNLVERLVLRGHAGVVDVADLPPEIVKQARMARAESVGDHPTGTHAARVDMLMESLLVRKESFWTAVYARFMVRDITREDVRYVVRAGLQKTQGSYRALMPLFNMQPHEYKRFLGFLKQHNCHIPFQGFRLAPLSVGLPSRRATDLSA